jgi:hypothetical protein
MTLSFMQMADSFKWGSVIQVNEKFKILIIMIDDYFKSLISSKLDKYRTDGSQFATKSIVTEFSIFY